MAQGIHIFDSRIAKTIGTTGAWTDLDLSANIPAGSSGAIFLVVAIGATSTQSFSFRKNGITNTEWGADFPAVSSGNMDGVLYFTGVDSNRICEYYAGTSTNFSMYLLGYTDSQFVFFDTYYDYSSSLTNKVTGWYDITCSELAGLGAKGVVVIGRNDPTKTWPHLDLRANGSTDASFNSGGSQVVGVDASNIFEFYCNSDNFSSNKCFVVGYVKDCLHWNTNYSQPFSTNYSWTNADITSATSATAKAVLCLTKSDTTTYVDGIRNKNSTDANTNSHAYELLAAELDADGVLGHIGESGDIYLRAYFEDVSSGPVAPTVTTQAVSAISTTTATGNGNVTADGGDTITERGICWNTSTGPTTANSKATAAGTTGAYTASMTSLTAGTLYYVRAYATNSVGTSYGDNVTFTSNVAVRAANALLLGVS